VYVYVFLDLLYIRSMRTDMTLAHIRNCIPHHGEQEIVDTINILIEKGLMTSTPYGKTVAYRSTEKGRETFAKLRDVIDAFKGGE